MKSVNLDFTKFCTVRILTALKRRVVAPTLYYSGFPFRSIPNGPQNVIFNYHGVVDDFTPQINNRHLSKSQFEQDLKFFTKRFTVVPLNEIFEHPMKRHAGNKAKLAITFDDGYENNFRYAIPLLEKYNLPATIFVLSATVEDPFFVNWADMLDVMFATKAHHKIDFLGLEFFRSDSGYHTMSSPRISLAEFIKDQGISRLEPLKKLSRDLFSDQGLLARFRDHVKLMDVDQLRVCGKNKLIEIGSHSRNHFNIGRISADLAKFELENSKTELESLLQKDVLSIAYPDGDYSDDVKQLADDAGYRRQLAVNFQLASDPSDSRIRRRFSYSNSTTHESNMVRLGLNWGKFSF